MRNLLSSNSSHRHRRVITSSRLFDPWDSILSSCSVPWSSSLWGLQLESITWTSSSGRWDHQRSGRQHVHSAENWFLFASLVLLGVSDILPLSLPSCLLLGACLETSQLVVWALLPPHLKWQRKDWNVEKDEAYLLSLETEAAARSSLNWSEASNSFLLLSLYVSDVFVKILVAILSSASISISCPPRLAEVVVSSNINWYHGTRHFLMMFTMSSSVGGEMVPQPFKMLSSVVWMMVFYL